MCAALPCARSLILRDISTTEHDVEGTFNQLKRWYVLLQHVAVASDIKQHKLVSLLRVLAGARCIKSHSDLICFAQH